MALSETASALQKASEWLTYQSETDTPWTAFAWQEMSGEPDGERIRQKGRHRPTAPAIEESIDAFFTPLTQEQDWYREEEKAVSAKYEVLRGVVQAHLTNPKVIRIGERKIVLYIVGLAKEGGWAGLKTTAVET
jgi:hypothetical protein